jgi:hypothetical protein
MQTSKWEDKTCWGYSTASSAITPAGFSTVSRMKGPDRSIDAAVLVQTHYNDEIHI